MPAVMYLAQQEELLTQAEELKVVERNGRRHMLMATDSSVWLVTEWADAARIACRLAFSPGELAVVAIDKAPDRSGLEIAMSSAIGSQKAVVSFADDGTISATTTLRAAKDLTFEGWPRDVIPDLDGVSDGKVHTKQRGLRTGLVHASLTIPAAGSFMYLQDLTRLGEYFEATRSSAADTVGGEWPELGFALPTGEQPLREGTSLVISSWHLVLDDEVPENAVAVADQYLALLAQLYFHIERPTPEFVDWRERAELSRADLERSEGCWFESKGRRYLRAYVGDDNHPPESMVQLAVLVPLIERSEWLGRPDPLAGPLADLMGTFKDKTGLVGRWLASEVDLLEGEEPHEHPRLMDAWYLFHPLLNLGRLAERGDERARKLLLGSLDRVIEIAHHFHHVWPVFYDLDTLEVVQAESEPGKGGEPDVPGLYAHVMLQAYELTKEQRYLDEALTAARSLRRKGFELTYQLNNVAFGMLAMLRLYQETGDRELLDISRVLASCLFDNVGLWSMRYGHGASRSSFCATFPMPETPYTAAYEEAEVAATVLQYLVGAGEDIAPSLGVLLPELVRHVTAKLDAYYPQNLGKQALAPEPKTGHTEPDLWVPMEDVGDGWEEAGTVGQEVYGAGIAFSTVARTVVRVPGSDVQLSCEYPYRVLDASPDEVRLHIFGDPRLKGRVRVFLGGASGTSGDESARGDDGARGDEGDDGEEEGWRDHWVAGGADVTIPLK